VQPLKHRVAAGTVATPMALELLDDGWSPSLLDPRDRNLPAGDLLYRIASKSWLERHLNDCLKEKLAGLRLEHSVWSMDAADLWWPRHGHQGEILPCKVQSGHM
jgi:hypothetical protein